MAIRHRLRVARGAGDDARARARPLVDRRARLGLLHGQGAARALRRPLPPRRRARWRTHDSRSAPRSPRRSSSLLLLLVVFELIRSRRLRERYALLWLATGVVLVALSAWRGGLNTIAGWFGVRELPAGGAVRGRAAVRDPRAAALLDGDLAALRPEHDPRAAARAARVAARASATDEPRQSTSRRGRRAEQHRVPDRGGGGTPATIADAVGPAPGRGAVGEARDGRSTAIGAPGRQQSAERRRRCACSRIACARGRSRTRPASTRRSAAAR